MCGGRGRARPDQRGDTATQDRYARSAGATLQDHQHDEREEGQGASRVYCLLDEKVEMQVLSRSLIPEDHSDSL